MPRFNESAAVRPVIMRFVEQDEVVVAEGRSNVILPHHPRGNVLNRSYLVVTTKRLLWVNVGASIKPTRFPSMRFPSLISSDPMRLVRAGALRFTS